MGHYKLQVTYLNPGASRVCCTKPWRQQPTSGPAWCLTKQFSYAERQKEKKKKAVLATHHAAQGHIHLSLNDNGTLEARLHTLIQARAAFAALNPGGNSPHLAVRGAFESSSSHTARSAGSRTHSRARRPGTHMAGPWGSVGFRV
jgi:hypothetical protein